MTADKNRKNLAAAIALYAGSRRDLRVADDAASLAAQKCWDAQNRLEELRKVVEPSGSRADAFIASIAAGTPCDTDVLEKSKIDSRAKLTAAENDASVWDETRSECDLAAREKETAVAAARERVARAAREVICNECDVANLIDDLVAVQSEVIKKRAALRFIWGCGLNGELSATDKVRIERLLRQDLTGMEPHPVRDAWQSALDALMSDADAGLPS